MRKVRNLLKNDRGIVIEAAICMMLLVFSLCTIMVVNAMVSKKQNAKASAEFLEWAAVEQIGEDFCTEVANASIQNRDPDFTPGNAEDYSAVYAQDGATGYYHLEVRKAGQSPVLLYVVVAKADTSPYYKVLRWSRFSLTDYLGNMQDEPTPSETENDEADQGDN